jgi:hypothetical protein
MLVLRTTFPVLEVAVGIRDTELLGGVSFVF